MSALPQDAGRRETRRQTELLVEALQSSAAAHHWLEAAETRIRRALDEDAEELLYVWQTPDQREAQMRLYYRHGEDLDLLAAELLQIDYRQPTLQERARYEDEFEAELNAAGELWRDVASHIGG